MNYSNKKMALTLVLTALFLSFTGFPVLANTTESIDKNPQSVEDNSIVMGVYDAPPNIIRNEDGIKGISPQYIKVIEMVSELEVTLKPMPYSRLTLSSTRKNTGVINSFIHPELEKTSEILVRNGKVKVFLVTLNGVDLYSKSVNEDVSVGMTRGLLSIVKELKHSEHKWWNVVSVNDEEHGLRAVMLGRLDGVYVTDIAYDYFKDLDPRMKEANFTLTDAGFLDIYLWVRKGEANKPKYQRLKTIVNRITLNGRLPVKWWDISDFLDFFSRSE